MHKKTPVGGSTFLISSSDGAAAVGVGGGGGDATTTMATITPEIQSLGVSFQELRKQKGHWDGGDHNPDLDNFNGKKHEYLKKLGDHFGKVGTPATEIFKAMGQPDEVKMSMDEAFSASLMPGHMVSGGDPKSSAAGAGAGRSGELNTTVMPEGHDQPQQVMYFVYKWRGNHDYLWFKVDAVTETVLESSWYHAYE
ncbi:hypothetical protein BGZ73_002271 [Actinomortierella ambigua]|nr:hypothetical protein BGZ73_002271 [Actinomortierella ambigua]